MLSELLDFFWPRGLGYLLFGLIYGEFVGYWYHRLFQHAIVKMVTRVEDGRLKKLRYLFVPWKEGYAIHMWHHYSLFPEPNAPGIKPVTFRPYHVYDTGRDRPDNPFKIDSPSGNAAFDRFQYYFSKVSPYEIDWVLIAALFVILPTYLLLSHDVPALVYFLAGFPIAAFLNRYIHDSFHVRPYRKLSEVPSSHWLKPAVFFANLGEHLPGFQAYYRRLLERHIAHHYQVVKPDASNVRYHGMILNAQIVNFTIYNPLFDHLFGTSSSRKYGEVM